MQLMMPLKYGADCPIVPDSCSYIPYPLRQNLSPKSKSVNRLGTIEKDHMRDSIRITHAGDTLDGSGCTSKLAR